MVASPSQHQVFKGRGTGTGYQIQDTLLAKENSNCSLLGAGHTAKASSAFSDDTRFLVA